MIRVHTTILLSIIMLGCTNEHRAQQTIAAYQKAIQNNDAAGFARLASANERTMINEQYFKRDDTFWFIDAITKNTVRTIRTKNAVAYLGWVPGRESQLFPLLVGEGNALRYYGALHDYPPGTADWQVSMIASGAWAIVVARDAAEKARIESALAKLDDQQFTAWFFEGNNDAGKAIQAALQQ